MVLGVLSPTYAIPYAIPYSVYYAIRYTVPLTHRKRHAAEADLNYCVESKQNTTFSTQSHGQLKETVYFFEGLMYVACAFIPPFLSFSFERVPISCLVNYTYSTGQMSTFHILGGCDSMSRTEIRCLLVVQIEQKEMPLSATVLVLT